MISLASELLSDEPPETLREIILRQDAINQNNPLQPQQSNSPNPPGFQEPPKQGSEPITEFFDAIKNHIDTSNFTLDGQCIVVLGCAIKMQIQKNGQNYEIICDIRNKDEDQGTADGILKKKGE